jgi:hypothetical protein
MAMIKWFRDLSKINRFFVVSGIASIASILLGFVFWYFPRTFEPPLGPKFSAQTNNKKVDQDVPLGVSMDDVLAMLVSESLTELQKSQFIRRNNGAHVQWSGIVVEVTPMWKNDPNSEILVLFRSISQKDKTFPEIVVARFNSSSEPDLAGLSSGDFIVIEGILQFPDLKIDKPSLEDAKLISFKKRE